LAALPGRASEKVWKKLKEKLINPIWKIMTIKMLKSLFIILIWSAFTKTFAQEITFKELNGKWDYKVQTDMTLTYNFINDSTVILDDPGEKSQRCYYKFIFYNNEQLLGIQMQGRDSTRMIYKIPKVNATELHLQLFQISEYDRKTNQWRGQDAPKVVILKFIKRASNKK